MPKRSNLHQAVIYYVKRHYAPPEVVVTESRMLYDRDSEEDREVGSRPVTQEVGQSP